MKSSVVLIRFLFVAQFLFLTACTGSGGSSSGVEVVTEKPSDPEGGQTVTPAPTPDPIVEPTPTPTPDPIVTPTPGPTPAPTPAPTPTPSPTPQPTPAPTPVPTPVPTPAPAPTPTPTPSPTPPVAGPGSCGVNYSFVAANASLGTSALCVARFEMKSNGAGAVISKPAGVPVTASLQNARSFCAGAGGRLPTNAEWNAIAVEIHGKSTNWATVAGKSRLITGVNAWVAPLSVSAESNAYDQVPGTPTLQRRKFILAGGEAIWDFGGNVWEWVETSINGNSFTPSFRDNWGHRPQDTYWFPLGSSQLSTFFPVSSPSTEKSLGVVFGGTTGNVIRGAAVYMGNFDEVGIFSAALDVQETDNASPRGYWIDQNLKNIGFRCVIDL